MFSFYFIIFIFGGEFFIFFFHFLWQGIFIFLLDECLLLGLSL